MDDRPRADQQDSRILPLVAITGTRGKSTTAWLLAHILATRGIRLGIWSSTGVFVDGHQLPGELQAWAAVVQAVMQGELALAIQELDTAVVASVGLPEATYAWAAVTTVCGTDEDCLLAPSTRYALRAVEIVARAVHRNGVLVLNADDPVLLDVAEGSSAHVVLFALHPDNPVIRRARVEHRPALWHQDGSIIANASLLELTKTASLHLSLLPFLDDAADKAYPSDTSIPVGPAADRAIGTDAREVTILDVREAPCTLDGRLAFQIQNILCATALALAIGAPPGAIRTAVRTFSPSPVLQPGACNVLSIRGRPLVVDGARDPWTLRALIRGIRQYNPRKTIVVTHDFPWLDEEGLREIGRILGRINGLVILSEPLPQDRLRAFREGIIANAFPPVLVEQPDLSRAVVTALNAAKRGDLCLVLTKAPEETIPILEWIDRALL